MEKGRRAPRWRPTLPRTSLRLSARLTAGVIQQGTRDDVFFRPVNPRVAEFVQTGNILPAVVERVEAETLWLRWQGHAIAAPPQPVAPGTPVYLCVRPTQVLIVRPTRLHARVRENLLHGTIVRETMQAETYTLYLRLAHSDAAYDLEIALPSYVYYRLGLEVTKHLTVELRRQSLHIIPRRVDAPTHSAVPSDGSLIPSMTGQH